MSKLKTNSLRKILNIIYTPISIIFIIFLGWENRELLAKLLSSVNKAILCYSLASLCSLHLLLPLIPKIILSINNPNISYRRLLEIHISRLPARYIPGGIWHTVGRLSDLHIEGVSKTNLTLLVTAESLLPCFMAFFLGGGYLWISETGRTGLHYFEGISAIISLLALLIMPLIMSKKTSVKNRGAHLRAYIMSLLTTIVIWGIASCSFILYIFSFPAIGQNSPLAKIVATYMFSWGVGNLAIFAPQGIGVFEFILGEMIILPITLGGAIAFLAGFRLVTLIADGVVWITYRIVLTLCGTEEKAN